MNQSNIIVYFMLPYVLRDTSKPLMGCLRRLFAAHVMALLAVRTIGEAMMLGISSLEKFES